MQKFVLVTRGRTGSTAVIDELNKTRFLCAQHELFILKEFAGEMGTDGDYYTMLFPFDLWKWQGWWTQQMQRFTDYFSEPRQADRYLRRAEKLARRRGAKGFGWKMLSHQFDERPYLGELLRQHGYRVVYLRRNSVRQVLSGMVARQRGRYNSLEKVVDQRRYPIDIEEFKWHVQWERECVKNDLARLDADGFDFVDVRYEDYCDNRELFFGKIFDLLDLSLELPPPSDFQKMIEDPELVIENYAEVAEIAAAMGEKF